MFVASANEGGTEYVHYIVYTPRIERHALSGSTMESSLCTYRLPRLPQKR